MQEQLLAELIANPIPLPPEPLDEDGQPLVVPPYVVDGSELTIQDLMAVDDPAAMKDKDLSAWLDEREQLGLQRMASTNATGLAHVDDSVVRTLAQKYRADGNKLKCRGNALTRSCAFTGSFVILECGRRILYPNCPGALPLLPLPPSPPPPYPPSPPSITHPTNSHHCLLLYFRLDSGN